MDREGIVLETVVNECVNLGSFGHADERTGHLQRATLDRKCLDDDARSIVAVRMPLTGSCLEANREHSARERATSNAIVVDCNPIWVRSDGINTVWRPA